MKKYFIILVLSLYITPSFALNALLRQELKKLDLQTRQEQRCDIAAMEAIAAAHGRYSPDKAIAYSFAEPIIKGNLLVAPGAAFRSHHNWYHLSFSCQTTDDKLDVKSFSYKIGNIVPPSEWKEYYLVP